MTHKTHPRKHAENSHLMPSMNPHKYANRVKGKWHKARRAGKLGEQVDRAFYAKYQSENKTRDIQALKSSL
jgi:hypothetical protein